MSSLNVHIPFVTLSAHCRFWLFLFEGFRVSVFLIIGAGLETERGRGTNKWGLATKPQRPGQNPFVPKEWLPEPLGPKFQISKPPVKKSLADLLDECGQHLWALLTQALVLPFRKGVDGKVIFLQCKSRVTYSAFGCWGPRLLQTISRTLATT